MSDHHKLMIKYDFIYELLVCTRNGPCLITFTLCTHCEATVDTGHWVKSHAALPIFSTQYQTVVASTKYTFTCESTLHVVCTAHLHTINKHFITYNYTVVTVVWDMFI